MPVGIRPSDKSPRKPRADAARNRERVLEAAKTVFSAGGAEASLEAVARAAGVGIGTLYRHFPTREALFEAVYRREVQQLADLAEQLEGRRRSPSRRCVNGCARTCKFVATKKGMSAALALAAYKNSELFSYSFDRLTRAVGGLLDRAIAAGEIRDDISPEDLLRALVGMCYMHDQPGWQKSVLRLVDVFVDGLRNRRAARDQATQKPSRQFNRRLSRRRLLLTSFGACARPPGRAQPPLPVAAGRRRGRARQNRTASRSKW